MPQKLSLSLPLRLLLLVSLFSTAIPQPLRTTLRQQQQQQPPPTITPPSAANGGEVAVELWCVAKNNAEDSALQAALDWACGPGGADCKPIQQGGACYDAADIRRTASYAFNDYYLKSGMTDDSCNFDNTAALTSLNPSHNNCKFPSSLGGKSGRSSQGTFGPSSADSSKGYIVGSRKWVWTIIMFHLLIAIRLIL